MHTHYCNFCSKEHQNCADCSSNEYCREIICLDCYEKGAMYEETKEALNLLAHLGFEITVDGTKARLESKHFDS